MNACIKKLYLWKEVKHLKLITIRPMRVYLHGDREADAFAEMLIDVVDGKANILFNSPIWSVSQS